MIYIGSSPKYIFKTNKKYTKETFNCALTSCFNLILYSNYSAIISDEIKTVGIVVPVHYTSFIRTFDEKISLKESITKFFIFDDYEGKDALLFFVNNIKEERFCKIKDLIIK
ncbi:hypothetical protein H311_01622 [Anncaliia algerae PRA109]|nr:hypothetical protein H311_01622 [Anncaliia algerae PRA109]